MKTGRLAYWLGVASLALVLAACPKNTPVQGAPTASTPSQPAAADDPQGAATRQDESAASQPDRKMRTGGPLPPRRVPTPVEIDRSCNTAADCTVKDVGSCCGYQPACVNVHSPTDPAAVRAECARRGESSTCGVQEISACQCVQGLCRAQVPAIDPPVDPAPQVPEIR